MDATDLAFAGVARQAELVARGEVSARELTEIYLERIDAPRPGLNAFRVVFDERALAEADQADGRAAAATRRPLLGVPIAIKDDIDVAGESTAWGCDATGGRRPPTPRWSAGCAPPGRSILGKTQRPGAR